MPNRLANESSPYLLQHRNNPVDWYPWGDEAFERARSEDRPIFLSIGYAACHWCHVMERESFENDGIAAVMNELFVNIKVDREEHPDVDAVYMTAIQLTGQGGGWPLSAFCTPDGTPFHLGTYFPPIDTMGRPGFASILRWAAAAYHERRELVDEIAAQLRGGLSAVERAVERSASAPTDTRNGLLAAAGHALVQHSDPVNGGFGGAPKFPCPPAHALLGRLSLLDSSRDVREAFIRQAVNMARGGIYDHVGGGFARYSVDGHWLVPHFEKMLYDNGQLLGIYADAHAMTGDPEFSAVVSGIIAWLVREMRAPDGGLYASLDADSEGEEGKFYVWTAAEIDRALGDDAPAFRAAYGVTDIGNFEHGTTVLSRVGESGDLESEALLARARAHLHELRTRRARPATDTKLLASWNGLALSGLVRAWECTGDERAKELFGDITRFVCDALIYRDGDATRIRRVHRSAGPPLEGTLDDYATVAEGLMAVAEATLDRAPWDIASELLATVTDRFYHPDNGGRFFLVPEDGDPHLIHRPISNTDNATPAGASVAVAGLIRLGLVCDDRRAMAIAEDYLEAHLGVARGMPIAFASLLAAYDLLVNGAVVVVSGGTGHDDMLAAFRRSYAPAAMLAGPWAASTLRDGKTAIDGRSAAYVCRGQTCTAPITDPEQLIAGLARG